MEGRKKALPTLLLCYVRPAIYLGSVLVLFSCRSGSGHGHTGQPTDPTASPSEEWYAKKSTGKLRGKREEGREDRRSVGRSVLVCSVGHPAGGRRGSH